MASRLQLQGDDSVLLHVTHSNIKSFNADIRLSLQMTVEAVKEKLWRKCGTSVNLMSLELYDDAGSKVAELGDNARPFGYYSPMNGYRLHVVDLDPSSVTSGGWLDDTSLVEKYTISEEDYAKRDGTFRKFKEKLAHKNPTDTSTKVPDNYMEDLCTNIKVGDRCQVQPGDKRGVVKFVGRAENLGPGFWVGVQYDEPLGKHDGMVRGVRYFDCPPLQGGMVRPDKVQDRPWSGFKERFEEMESTRIQRLSLLQAEKDLQKNKSHVLSAKLADIRSLEQRCLTLDQKFASDNFKISSLKSQIDFFDNKYQTCSQTMRKLKVEVEELEQLVKETESSYAVKCSGMEQFTELAKKFYASTDTSVEEFRCRRDELMLRCLQLKRSSKQAQDLDLQVAEKRRLELLALKEQVASSLESSKLEKAELQRQLLSLS